MAGARGEEAPSEVVTAIKFSFYTEEDARKMSVKRITEPILYDDRGNPAPNGLFDPALGPVKDTDSCKTCCQRSYQCSGHIGHIELAKPLYNPLLFTNLKRLLQVSCFYCHKFRMKEEEVRRYVSMLNFIKKGDIALAGSLNQLWLTKMLFQEEYEEKFTAVRWSESHSDSENQQNPWTTLQNEKAESLLSEFMGRTTTKCLNCNRKNPRITSPTFGCLNKAMKASDARANAIRNSNIGVKSDTSISSEAKKGEVLQSKAGANSSWRDKEMSVSRNRSKKTSPEIFEHKVPSAGQEPLLPTEAELILQGLWSSEPEFCSLICDIRNNSLNLSRSNKGYAMFFLKALLVPPCKFRPPAEAGQRILEHPQNDLLKKVQIVNNSLRNIITTDPGHEDTLRLWTDLQRSVNILFDSSKGIGKSDREATGYRQLLERKEGVIRQKMMGKRVDFSCRSVISPDPYLAVHEIGIPPYFALRLTIPERVTPWNVNKLRHAVINGADLHPGATHYKDNNSMFKLQAKRDTRCAISRKLPASRAVTSRTGKDPESEYEGKVVFRHLQDGDVVLVNRQPTLHKPSMMAHIVRVLKGEKTIRMHYANCKTYNADFDGDEMNVHVPQDEISRAEAINIVNANKQYIVPTSGDPIRGLIQDHIVSAVLLTKLDTFLTREEYHQLLYGSCVPPVAHSFEHGELGKSHTLTSSNEVQPLPPAILKPQPLWTGKQVITTILHYITRGRQPFTVEKKGQVPKEYFVANCFESVMHINSNELIHGMIDKAQFGNYGLVHTVYELYGADTAGTLLSIFSRLFTLFLQMHGFTCGLDDLLLIPHSDQERKEMLKDSEVESHVVHCNFASQDSRDQDPRKLPRQIEKILRSNGESAITRLDRMMSNSLNGLASDVNKKLFPTGLRKPFPKNCISLMTSTGAKGGLVNLTQISSLLGQQELEGKRVPRMVSGKTLPCFPPWDISSRAGGFIGDRFLTGLRPQEYYFHCMAGRDGLVDTAIKTARSGYLQRCILKNLESLKVCYDYTVRDADGSVIQFTYGEDGVDVLKTSLITELKDANDQLAPFKLLAINRRVALEKLGGELEHAHFSKSNGFIRELPDKLRENATTFANSLLKNHKDSLHKIKRNEVMKLMELKYLDSLADPGEPVGVIAAQSVGEPSTQMTLNTFHLAGRGEMNVTLGIPRLQEILYGSKNIRTPVMTCPLLSGRTEKDGKHLAAKLRRVCVADVVESVEVSTVPFCIHQDKVSTIYKLKMKLYAPHLYPQHSGITLEGCRAVLTTTFVEVMEDAIEKHLLLLSKINDISVVSGKEEYTFADGVEEHASKSDNGEDNDSHGVGGDSNDHDDGEAGDTEDEDADTEKRKKQKNDEMEYEDSMDKERSTLADEHNEDEHSEEPGCESEIDDVEANEDYEVGSEIPSYEGEVKLPESPSRTEPEPLEKKSTKELKSKEKGRKKNRKKIDRAIFVEAKGLDFEAHFILDTKPHILLAEIAQKTAKRVYVKASNNIERCSVIKQKDNKHSTLALQAAGVNFNAFYGLSDHLNIDEIVSNDVNAMLKHYGVEAARKTIVEEVKAVFEAYGIHVNIRHLTLIADFITSSGGYRPMNRLGMGDFNTSPFEKMSFETATKFIIKAAFHGEVDTLESPSASVSLGQPVKFGTGSFDVLQNLQ